MNTLDASLQFSPALSPVILIYLFKTFYKGTFWYNIKLVLVQTDLKMNPNSKGLIQFNATKNKSCLLITKHLAVVLVENIISVENNLSFDLVLVKYENNFNAFTIVY